MGKINSRSNNSFVGRTLVGCKKKVKMVFSKRQNKMVEVTEYKGSFTASNGASFSIKVSRSSDDAMSAKGVGYWVEVAEFSSNGGR